MVKSQGKKKTSGKNVAKEDKKKIALKKKLKKKGNKRSWKMTAFLVALWFSLAKVLYEFLRLKILC